MAALHAYRAARRRLVDRALGGNHREAFSEDSIELLTSSQRAYQPEVTGLGRSHRLRLLDLGSPLPLSIRPVSPWSEDQRPPRSTGPWGRGHLQLPDRRPTRTALTPMSTSAPTMAKVITTASAPMKG